jgi:nucleoid-associated protein YgaU
MDTARFARLARDFVVDNWKSGLAKAVFLAGYSRGAAAVIEVAKWLKEEENIPVECLILFDAVDRSTTIGGIVFNTPIVDTVKQVIYPQRDIWRTLSRISFQNCGFTKQNPATPFLHKKFFATHGGLGGTPWTEAKNPYTGASRDTIWELGEVNPTRVTPKADEDGSKDVWGWVNPRIKNAYNYCRQRLENPGEPVDYIPGKPGINPPGNYIPGFPNQNQKVYVVQPGDWLSKIAIKFYGDANKWTKIYEVPANKAVIGANPNLIQPGMRLQIP